ncbi:MAG: ABC transporter permease [Myxococcota bacterium]|nr:ABC transporter permease [Myxococcota bacterium]
MSGVEFVALLFGLAIVTLPVWMSRRAVRWLGAFWMALAVGVTLRATGVLGSSIEFAALASATVFALAYLSNAVALLRRVAFLVPSLVLLIYVTTLLMYKAPGNPFANERSASPQVEAALRAQYGVPENATEFFGIYTRRLVVEGTMGPSIKVAGRNVEDLLFPALPVSLTLGLLALTIACALGLGFGLRAGLAPHSWSDHASMALALVGISLPNFVLGAGLIVVFALQFGWFPVAGWGTVGHLWLPALTLALPYGAYIARLVRAGTIEAMQQDFVRTARAKGLPESEVVLRHAFRAAVAPAVAYLGPAAAGIMTGSFVVEVLFGIPGMGQWFVKGAINRDYSVVLGTATIYFTLITLLNFGVDIAQAWLDPRVRSADRDGDFA